jgi:hypothetical protein
MTGVAPTGPRTPERGRQALEGWGAVMVRRQISVDVAPACASASSEVQDAW